MVGYRRLETEAERELLNALYRDLTLYKNFFQPTMKLAEQRRVRGKIHRCYEEANTPYQRLLECGQPDRGARQQMEALYESLNPAELKRRIEQKQKKLFELQ